MIREPMTQEAYEALSQEFKNLNNVIKPTVNREKQVAAEQGDRSENAEYHAAKEKLRHIDKRLKYLSSLLDIAQIIDPSVLDHSHVCFGSTVTIEDLENQEVQDITISGILESEPENGIISFKSPIGKALMNKEEGDEVQVQLPKSVKIYEIISITYIPIMQRKQEPFRAFDIK